MNVETQETGAVERRLRIEIPTADVDAAFERVYRRLRQRAKIPGFRPGKAPRTVLERYFGESAQSDTFEELVRQTLGQAIEDAQLAVITEPRLSPPQGLPKQGAPFVYEASVEIRPSIELKLVRGLDVKQPKLPEPDRDPVEAHLEELRLQQAAVVDEEAGAAVARGNIAIVHYDGSAGGEPLPGGPRRDVEVEVGTGRSLPGFEDELIGMRVGDHKDIGLDMPADDPRETIAGKRIELHVELAGLKRRDLAPLDDEFAKDVSQLETLEALRTDLRERVERGRETERKRLLRDAVIDAVVAANPFPVPPSLVERQLQRRIQRAHQSLHGQLSEEMIERTVADFRERWGGQAERDVRLSFLVDEIARAEGIEVSDDDYDAHLRLAASESGKSLSAIQREYREHGVADAVRAGLRDERVIDFLTAEAKLSSD